MKTMMFVLASLLIGCGGKSAPTSAAPAPVSFVDDGESLAADGAPLVLAGGKATVAVVAQPGAHGPVVVRAIVDGKRVDLFSTTTGDCGGGTVVEAAEVDGAVVVELGQVSYTDCDDDAEREADADIDSHLECAKLAWSPASSTVEVTRTPRVGDDSELPDWCTAEIAALGED